MLADNVLAFASRLGKSSEDASSLAKLIGKKDPDDVRNALLLCTQPPSPRLNKQVGSQLDGIACSKRNCRKSCWALNDPYGLR